MNWQIMSRIKRIKPEELKDPNLREKLREVILNYLSMGLDREQIRKLLGLPTQDDRHRVQSRS